MKYIIFAFLIFLFLRFVINILFPILKLRSAAKSKMKEMNDFFNQQQQNTQNNNKNTHSTIQNKSREGEYIDYEEV